jgi:FAD/FMN-containing dehydrogenase
MSAEPGGKTTWTNWAGNQSFTAHVAAPASEEEVVALVRAALAAVRASAPRAPGTRSRP